MAKEIVRLRRKRLKDGSESLYLDIYINGQRNYEFLKLYIVPENSRKDKAANRETLRLAEVIKAQRIVDVERGVYGLQSGNAYTLFEWCCKVIAEKNARGEFTGNLVSALAMVRRFHGVKLSAIGKETMQRIKDCIFEQDLRDNTKSVYFGRIKMCLRKAANSGLMRLDVVASVSNEGITDAEREFLTIEELQTLFDTDYKDSVLKRAFLFSCCTGLRKVDVRALTWGKVFADGNGTKIAFRQIKTGRQEYLDISEQAAELMGERGADTERVFPMAKNNHLADRLTDWCASVGINKRITFHCARHTFAVMMLELDVNIAVIQKLLGHTKLDTTMIYAKVVDKSKRNAVSLIPHFTQKKY